MAEPTSARPYDKAYNLAVEKLASANLEDVAFNSSVQLEGDALKLNFLGEIFQAAEKGKKIYRTHSPEEVKIAEKIIILHYLITADGTPPAPQQVAFPDIPGSAFYYPTFKARTMDLLERVFQSVPTADPPECGNEVTRFLVISERLGARIEPTALAPGVNHGSAQFLALPNVPITLLYWSGAEQLPPTSQILYNANITHYLPLEDIVVITELLVHKIIKKAKETSNPMLYRGDGHLYEHT